LSHARRRFGFLLVLLVALWSQPSLAVVPNIEIRMGQTIVYTVPEGVDRVVVGDGDIIDAKPIAGQNRDLLISAKKPGFTNLLVWPAPERGPDGHMIQAPVRNYNIEVLTYRRPEMIAVRVKVLEVQRVGHDKTGVDWSQSVSFMEAPPNAPFRIGLPQRSTLLEATLNMLVQDRKAKLLAQPTLLTMNGSSASFLAGGEIPVPLLTANNAAVEWKPYGVKLQVDARVEGTDSLVLKVRPEVSRIDAANGVKLQTISVPALATRWTETVMQLKSGQGVVISGLLEDDHDEVVSGLPLLSAIPLLGELFKSHDVNTTSSELVFFLTPSIVANPDDMPEKDYGTH
jgi:Flp pilus assembly secretin CpaC